MMAFLKQQWLTILIVAIVGFVLLYVFDSNKQNPVKEQIILSPPEEPE